MNGRATSRDIKDLSKVLLDIQKNQNTIPITTFEVKSLTNLGTSYLVTSIYNGCEDKVIYLKSDGTQVEEDKDFINTEAEGIDFFVEEFPNLAIGTSYVNLDNELINIYSVTRGGIFQMEGTDYTVENNRVYFVSEIGENSGSEEDVRVVYLGINPLLTEKYAVTDDVTFEIAATGGVDTLAGNTGISYTKQEIKEIIANDIGSVYMVDGTPFKVTDDLLTIEVDLKPIGGEGYHLGDGSTLITATTSEASYKNNGSWTNLDTGGGRKDIKDGQYLELIPTSAEEIFVANGSILLVQVEFRKTS